MGHRSLQVTVVGKVCLYNEIASCIILFQQLYVQEDGKCTLRLQKLPMDVSSVYIRDMLAKAIVTVFN